MSDDVLPPGLKLHLGCFDQPVQGWMNTDVTPHIKLSRVPLAPVLAYRLGGIDAHRYAQHKSGVFRQLTKLDVSKRFPLEDGSVQAVFSSHLLEHLPPDVAAHCLSETARVLAAGGVARVGVPDLDRLVACYDRDQPDEFVFRVFESRHSRDKNRHHWMYNACSLATALLSAGLVQPVRRQYREGNCPDLESLDNRPDETLFMEARKP